MNIVTTLVMAFIIGIFLVVCLLVMWAKFLRKVEQGQAMVINSKKGTKVIFTAAVVFPILHRAEYIDISVKRIVIDRQGSEGLICKDNMRADIKVAFFVRVNKTEEDVQKVAQSVGCDRASDKSALQELFEAKFSEALKTAGKQFDFSALYTSRDQFKDEILKVIGTDLNGFVMDDAAIDFLEQTPIEMLNENNILDSEGIKKITQLTAEQITVSNQLTREREKVISQQDVEAKEAILELNRQLADTENRQKREVESIKAREEAETKKVQEEERLKAETARITTEEELQVAEQNKDRQIVVAQKNKERTEAVETERVEKDRMVEATERERIVALAQIEKDKVVEVEKKNIQNVIRERVTVERTVVEEQERIKDTEAFAGADRDKKVTITLAEKAAEEALVIDVKAAEASKNVAELKAEEDLFRTVKAADASKQAAELKAEEIVIQSEARQSAAERESAAKKMLAEAEIVEKAAPGLGQVKVTEAQTALIEKKGTAEAKVIELKLVSEAKGLDQKGTAEAKVQAMKFQSEAKGIENKANAMKLLDAVGRGHEEFKLRLNKEKEIELAEINIRRSVAESQAQILGQALKSANVDIVGGESTFFESVINAVSVGKTVDRYVKSSDVLSDIKESFFNADPEYFQSQFKRFFSQFNVSVDDVKDMSVSAALTKLVSMADNAEDRGSLYTLMSMAEMSGMGSRLLNSMKFLPALAKEDVE